MEKRNYMNELAREVIRQADEVGQETDQIVDDFAKAMNVDAEQLYEVVYSLEGRRKTSTEALLARSKTMRELAKSLS